MCRDTGSRALWQFSLLPHFNLRSYSHGKDVFHSVSYLYSMNFSLAPREEKRLKAQLRRLNIIIS